MVVTRSIKDMVTPLKYTQCARAVLLLIRIYSFRFDACQSLCMHTKAGTSLRLMSNGYLKGILRTWFILFHLPNIPGNVYLGLSLYSCLSTSAFEWYWFKLFFKIFIGFIHNNTIYNNHYRQYKSIHTKTIDKEALLVTNSNIIHCYSDITKPIYRVF